MKIQKLTRIASTFEYGYWIIHMWGYDKDGNYGYETDKLKDWYYIRKSDVGHLTPFEKQEIDFDKEYKTFDDDVAYKVTYTSIKEKNNIANAFPHSTYEADVPIETKYALMHKLEWSENRHIGYFDIETYTLDVNESRPQSPQAPITSIQLWSSKFDTCIIFAWHPEHTAIYPEPELQTMPDGNIRVLCRTEAEVIKSFFHFIKEYNVDVLTGWYSSQFDVPYILERCKLLNLNEADMSPCGYVKNYKVGEFWRTYMTGIDHIDMLDAIKDLGYNLSNFKLATASKEILGDTNLEKLEEVTWKDWKDNFEGFMQYGFRDVEILKEIANKLDIFNLYANLQELSNVPTMNYVLRKATVVDFYILSEMHGKMVFPSNNYNKKRKKYAGAIVLDPTEPGMHKNVAVLDYTSLYPTAIMAFNISPETFISSDTRLEDDNITSDELIEKLKSLDVDYIDTGVDEELFGKRYFFLGHSEKVGIFPKLLRKLFIRRQQINANLAAGKYSGNKKLAMEKRQIAIKLILNSAYGALGFPYFRLYKPECADAITFFARKALMFAVDTFNEKGNTVLYGDTDSIFIKENESEASTIKDQLPTYNESLKSNFVTQYNPNCQEDYNLMDLKFEKDMEVMYFGGAKKRYYGIVRDTGKKYIRGLNIIRKDAPSYIKSELNILVEMAVRGTLTPEYLYNLKEIIKTKPYKEIGIVKSFGRRFSEYKKNKPQHIKAAKWAMSLFDNVTITHNDNPYMFYVTSLCENEKKPNDRNRAICLLEDDLGLLDDTETRKLFEIDYDTFFDKQILQQLDEFDHIPLVKKVVKQVRKGK